MEELLGLAAFCISIVLIFALTCVAQDEDDEE